MHMVPDLIHSDTNLWGRGRTQENNYPYTWNMLETNKGAIYLSLIVNIYRVSKLRAVVGGERINKLIIFLALSELWSNRLPKFYI